MVFARYSHTERKREKKPLPPILQGALITKKKKKRLRRPPLPGKVRAAKDSLGQPRTLAGDFKTRDARHKKPGTVEYNLEVLRRMEITQRGYGYRSNVGGFVPLVDGGIDPEGFQTEEMLKSTKRERFLPCKKLHKFSINPEATGPKPPPVSKKSSTEEFRRVARRGMSRDPWGSFFTRPGQEPNTALDMHTTLRSLSGGNPGSGKSAKTLEEVY